ncbi:MAG: hypothetical protein K2O91_16930 [Lachnospiraceae bacterium]|nr:hypothetical protein [Lachnospiraceae bacterium]
MKIWAHRGCSQHYPENTLTAFEKAVSINGLTGIELDVQLTRDGKPVVCHDEKVDRTTDGIGDVRSFSLQELKKLQIDAGNGQIERIPTMEEVFDLIGGFLKKGLLLNIELKNSLYPYEGMEEKIIDMVYSRGIQDSVIYSSFYAQSLEKVKMLDSHARIGILDVKVSDCLYKLKGRCGADALHPYWKGMDISAGDLTGMTVRAWFGGQLYPKKPTGTKLDLDKLENQGITDVFLNEPEAYLK